MSKKDYEAIAAAFRASANTPEIDALGEDLCAYFAADNPLFDRERFLAACEGEGKA